MLLLLENGLQIRMSKVHGPIYFASDGPRKLVKNGCNFSFGGYMTERLTYAVIESHENRSLENLLARTDDAEIGCFVEVDIKYPESIKPKNKQPFPYVSKFST